MNIEEFDKAVTKAADELIAESKVVQAKWGKAIDDLHGQAKDLPEHLVNAVLIQQVKRIEKEVDGE